MRLLISKAWLETRGRFLVAAVVLAILGISTVLRTPATMAGWEALHRGETMSYALYIWLSLSHGFLQFLWVVSAIMLGLGGLMRERTAGTSGFTLALGGEYPLGVICWSLTCAALLLGMSVWRVSSEDF